jgi:hypothetical protein
MSEFPVVQWRNAVRISPVAIDCEIQHPRHGWIPFTASSEDSEEHSCMIYEEIALVLEE